MSWEMCAGSKRIAGVGVGAPDPAGRESSGVCCFAAEAKLTLVASLNVISINGGLASENQKNVAWW